MALVVDEKGKVLAPRVDRVGKALSSVANTLAKSKQDVAENDNELDVDKLASKYQTTVAPRHTATTGTINRPDVSSSGAGYTQAAPSAPASFKPASPKVPTSWDYQLANAKGRGERTKNYWGERYSSYDDDSQVGNTAANDAYIRAAMENGMSEQDAYDVMHRDDAYALGRTIGRIPSMLGFGDDTEATNRDMMVNPLVMDDGSVYDYDHMTSDAMTGTQYIRYAEMGMGGRPVEEIDPTRTYSKRRESVNYGFTPFTPDDMSFVNMVIDNAVDTPHRLGSMVGRLRETVSPDYTISFDGGTVSGEDFDRLSGPFIRQWEYYSKFEPERYLRPPADGSDVTTYVREYETPEVDGTTSYHYGHLYDIARVGDGTYIASFTDGTQALLSEDYVRSTLDSDGNVAMPEQRVPIEEARGTLPNDLASLNDVEGLLDTGDPIGRADVLYVPVLTMPDGTRIDIDTVYRLYYDPSAGDDEDYDDSDISYGFSGFGGLLPSNKPMRLNQSELFDLTGERGNVADFSDVGNNLIDWTLGSLPISIGRVSPWVYSVSGATSALRGQDPSTYDPVSDSYGLSAGDYDRYGNLRFGVFDDNGDIDEDRTGEVRLWNALGNAAVPLTEMIAGPVGEFGIPIGKIFGEVPANPGIGQQIKKMLIGAAEEGIEEDIGNFFDELTQYGPSGMFANQLTDELGNPRYDLSGHELRDYGTPLDERVQNFLDPTDLVNSFAGGVGVDLLMQLLPGGQAYEIVPAAQRTLARRATGVNPYIETDAERAAREARENGEVIPPEKLRELSEEYLSMFSDDTYDDDEYEER